MKRTQLCRAVVLLLVSAPFIFGQEKGFTVEPKPTEVLEKQAGIGERYALIVGISKYANPNINLNYADKDAEALSQVLLDSEIGAYKKENVRLLVNEEATRKNIMSALNSWLGTRVRPEDSILIYYSGHGALGNGSEAYWVTYDADVEDLYSSALSNKDISQMIAGLPAKRKLTLIDSCYSEATAKKYRAIVPSTVFNEFQGAGVVTITASTGQEKSVEVGGHGAFTYHLLAGLEGKGDTNGNGVVELDELWSYLNDKVQKTAADAGNKQTPVLLAERMEHGFPVTINPAKAAGTTLNQLKKLYGDGKITVEEVGEAEQLLSQRGADPEMRKLYQDLAFGVLTPDYFRKLRASNRPEVKTAGTAAQRSDSATNAPEVPLTAADPAEAAAYHAAELLNTTEGWQQFLSQFPSSVLVERARARVVAIQTQQQGEAMAYDIAKASDSEEGWRVYLNRFPGGNHIAEAKDHIDQLQAARRRKEREPAAYIMAESQNSEEGWMNFVREFPDSQLAVLAQTRLDELRKANREKENALYAKALENDTPQLWDQYIKEFSGGRFVKEAMDKRTTAVKRVEEENQYQTAAKTDTVVGWEAYLGKFPDAPRSANARTRVQQLTWAKFADVTAIPGGAFMMGNSSGEGDEKPPHKVELEPFHMGRTEVTNAQFAKFAQETGRRVPAPPAFDSNYTASQPDLPVVNVTYADAEAFCKWLTEKVGKPARLPTEAEWEYAARGGLSGALYPWGSGDPKTQARYKDNASKGVKTVGKEPFGPNKFGLYNMSGNVAEWVADYFSDNYYKASPAKKPTGPPSGKERVVRGGSWKSGKEELGVSRRSKMEPQKADEETGFRVVIAGLPQ